MAQKGQGKQRYMTHTMDQFPLKTTRPPFLATNSLRLWTSANAELPTAFQCGDELRNPTTDILAFLAWDLQTPRLDGLHDYLWLAGLMQPARELHRQRLLGRTICITERPEEHLVWHENTIFIKPLPEYLLGHAFWAASICPHEPLYRSALGLLWSYTWLVRSKSDLKIAHDLGLLPTSLDWAAWAGFSRDVLDRDQQQVWQEVDPRYAYGELRLTRLNTLYHLGFAGLSPQNLVWAYMTGSQRYTTFFQRNFGWLLAVFVYVTVVLSGMQVALATGRSAGDERFQELCYVVSLASMVLVLAAIVVVIFVWFGLFCFHLLSTIFFHRLIRARREKTASQS